MSKRAKKQIQVIEDVIEENIVAAQSFIESEEILGEEPKASRIKFVRLGTILNAAQHENLDECKTKSAKIRYLSSEGYSQGQIADYLGIRYQHVRNVLTTPLKRVVVGA